MSFFMNKDYWPNINKGLTERGQIIYSKDGEVSWCNTECNNEIYMHKRDPYSIHNCICPKCGKTIKLIELEKEG